MVCPSGEQIENRPHSTPSIRPTRNPKRIIVQWVGIGTHTHAHISQVVIPVLLPFIRQEGDVLFQQDNARPHTAAATQRTLRDVQ